MSYRTLLRLIPPEQPEADLLGAVKEIDKESVGWFTELLTGDFVPVYFLTKAESVFRQLSTRFPEEKFIVSGIGEDIDDLWTRSYANGDVRICTLETEWKRDEDAEERARQELSDLASNSSTKASKRQDEGA